MTILDCTLRDGANVVGKGFNRELTTMMVEGLIKAGIKTIEIGNAYGLGAYERNNATAPLTDLEYMECAAPYQAQAEIGMFFQVKNASEPYVELAKRHNLSFLRLGANAGDGAAAKEAVHIIKEAGIACYYSLMKAYVSSPEELAQEARLLADYGIDAVTIMDSAGTMMPEEVTQYVRAMVEAVDIPVGFHGHNNLGLSVANAMAAHKAGAASLDCGLLGMARSAGNCATEMLVAVFQRMGLLGEIDLYALLDFLDNELIPAMGPYDYKSYVAPMDLVFGLSGCHSSATKMFQDTAAELEVPLYPLIVEASKVDRKNPDRQLLEAVAQRLKTQKEPIA